MPSTEHEMRSGFWWGLPSHPSCPCRKTLSRENSHTALMADSRLKVCLRLGSRVVLPPANSIHQLAGLWLKRANTLYYPHIAEKKSTACDFSLELWQVHVDLEWWLIIGETSHRLSTPGELSAEHINSIRPCRIMVATFMMWFWSTSTCSLLCPDNTALYASMSDVVVFISLCGTGNLFFATKQYNKLGYDYCAWVVMEVARYPFAYTWSLIRLCFMIKSRSDIPAARIYYSIF